MRFDGTTLAAYRAGATPAARAQTVRDSLGSGTLTVELRDGETLVYAGTFAGPMTAGSDGSLSADVLLSGLVGTAGTPNAATWTCRIRNADGRYIEGSFGPGGRFTWSGGALVVGQAVRLRVTIAAAGGALPDMEILYDIDAGNADAAGRVVTESTVSCVVSRINFHWLFALDNALGRRPVIDVQYKARARAAGWKPFFSADRWAWIQADASEILSSPNRVQFQFAEPFPSSRVWIADKPVFTQWHFDQLASGLAADQSGVVSPSASASSAGVLMTSRAGNNAWGSAIGGNSVYGFVLEDGSQTPIMGARKRECVVTCGIHAGEVEDGWYLKGMIDFFLSGVGSAAEQLRREWKLVVYFALNPNGRRAGISRHNTYNITEDPNRDWYGAGAGTFDETVAVQAAAALDAPYHDAHFDLHSVEGLQRAGYYRRPEIPVGVYTAFVSAFQSDSGQSLSGGTSSASGTISEWAYHGRGAKFVLVSEPGNANGLPAETMQGYGKSYLVALMSIHSNGYLD